MCCGTSIGTGEGKTSTRRPPPLTETRQIRVAANDASADPHHAPKGTPPAARLQEAGNTALATDHDRIVEIVDARHGKGAPPIRFAARGTNPVDQHDITTAEPPGEGVARLVAAWIRDDAAANPSGLQEGRHLLQTNPCRGDVGFVVHEIKHGIPLAHHRAPGSP